MTEDRGALFSFLLRLHPTEPGQIAPGAGNQVQAAFLGMVRQGDPALSDWLHRPNQRRPYTVGLHQDFNHLTRAQLEGCRTKQQTIPVLSEQTYWLRITMLDATVFSTFAHSLITKPRTLTVRIGTARFQISRLLSIPETNVNTPTWIAHSSFAELHEVRRVQTSSTFEF